jgi:hypothetical protein
MCNNGGAIKAEDLCSSYTHASHNVIQRTAKFLSSVLTFGIIHFINWNDAKLALCGYYFYLHWYETATVIGSESGNICRPHSHYEVWIPRHMVYRQLIRI